MAVLLILAAALGLSDSWTDLSSGEKALEAWASPTGDWFSAAGAEPDSKSPKKLRPEPGFDHAGRGDRITASSGPGKQCRERREREAPVHNRNAHAESRIGNEERQTAKRNRL